ncbi:SRPBCC domain-containing protein [Roseateles sp. BYS87W]|uniref:SRPBCC domain-containing protein n=1 Tax=Pelomonas baiyunensis TaxID=3299026 RepID=A0ABW7GZ21_9BURK
MTADPAPDMTAADRTLATQRLLPAAPAQVWQALTDPAQLARWWGPAGFSNEVQHCDLREGGTWHFWMVAPDGQRYWNECRFTTLQPERHWALAHTVAPHFTLSLTLAAEGSGTRLHWAQCFETAALRQGLEGICRPANEQNLDRLAALLAAPAA